MKYLLDTNIIVDLLRRKNVQLLEKISKIGISNCCISDITLYELYCGAEKSNNPIHETLRVDTITSQMRILPIQNIVKEAARQRGYLMHEGCVIEDFDILIGTTAIVNNLTLVTGNNKHLERLKNIRIENWL
ncbi:MAG: PIN domain-containing protein [Bacteroidales bacterium]|nr:PIN domain-containing protein [Bacteroidales bacterium]